MSQVMPAYVGYKEIFPLFHWSLFSSTHGEYWQYYIYFPEKMCELKKCDFLQDSVKDEEVFWLVQDFGMSYENKSSDFVDVQKQFELLVLPRGIKTSYELRLRKSNPIDYVLHGKVKDDSLVAAFLGGGQ